MNLKVEEIVTAFYEDYMNGKLFKKAQQKAKEKLTAGDYKFTVFLRDWLETIKPTITETTYESYSQKCPLPDKIDTKKHTKVE